MRVRVGIAAAATLALVGALAGLRLGNRGDGPHGDDVGKTAEPNDAHADVRAPALAAAPRSARRSGADACVVTGVVRADGQPVTARIEARRTRPYASGSPVRGSETRTEETPYDPTDFAGRSPDAVAVAGTDGRFELVGLAPGEYALIATAGAPASAGNTQAHPPKGLAYATVPVAGSRTRADVDLVTADFSLEIHAKYADGSPWRVRVAIRDLTPVVADTDAQGAAILHGLTKGSHAVSVFGEGYRLDAAVEVPRESPWVVVRPTGLVALSGRVLDATDDSPVAGARVTANGADDAADVRIDTTTTSGEDGEFHLLAPPSISWVYARASGRGAAQVELHGQAQGLEIRMRRLAHIVGTVVEAASRRPVGGVRVLAGKPDDRDLREAASGRLVDDLGATQADDQGRFALDVDATRDVEVVAIGDGWCSKIVREGGSPRTTIVEVVAGVETALVLDVERAARVRGIVLDSERRPVAGATVRARDHVVRYPREEGWDDEYRKAGVPTVTGADGRFTFDAIVPGLDAELVVTAGSLHAWPLSLGRLEPGETRDVTLALPRMRALAVHVVHVADGSPVVGAYVTAGGDLDDWHAGTTDATGTAIFRDLSEATLHVKPWLADGGSFVEWRGVDVPASPSEPGPVPDAAVTLHVEAPPATQSPVSIPDAGGTASTNDVATTETITGIVRHADGSAAAGTNVIAFRLVEGVAERGIESSTIAARDGSFRLSVDRGTPAHLRATTERFGGKFSAEADASAGARGVELTLEATVRPESKDTLRVRVVGADGRPVASADAKVAITRGGFPSESSADVADGLVEIALPDGWDDDADAQLRLEIRDARGADGARLPVGFLRVGPLPVAKFPREIRLVPETTIQGLVRAADGKPVAGLALAALPADEDDVAWAERRRLWPSPREVLERAASATHTGTDGTFLLLGLADGEYRLVPIQPKSAAYVADDGRETHAHGGATGVVVTLRSAAAPVVHVLDPDGQPFEGAWIRALRAVDQQPADLERQWEELWWFYQTVRRSDDETTTDESGAIRLFGLDPDAKYTLHVSPRQSSRHLRTRVVESWNPGDSTFRLESRLSTHGVVRGPGGEPPDAPALVSWRHGASGRTGSFLTGEDGAFDVDDSAAGDLEFEATFGTDPDGPKAKARVTAGETDAVLTLDFGAEISVDVERSSRRTRVSLARDDAAPSSAVSRAVGSDGLVHLRGLLPSRTYTIWTSSQGDERPGIATGIRPSPEVVTLVRATPKSIAVRATAGVTLRTVTAFARRGPVEVNETARVKGAIPALHLNGLVEGRWHVTVTGEDGGGASYEGSADADAGNEIEVPLKSVGPPPAADR